MHPGSERHPAAPARAAVFVLAMALGLAARTTDVRSWLNTGIPADDAFYYFKVAGNLAAGLGSTFDGLHRTNGYQPLWLWLLAPLAGVLHAPESFLRATVLLQAALAAATLALLTRPADGSGAWKQALPLLLLASTERFWRLTLTGLETALLLLCLAWTWLALERAWRSDWRRGDMLRLGVALAVACLARTDSLILAALTVAWCASRLRRRPRDLAALVLPLLAIVGPYLLWNRLTFGEWMPISGAVKHAYAEYQLHQGAAGGGGIGLRLRYLAWPLQTGMHAVLVLILAEAAVIAIAWWQGERPLALLAGAMLAKYAVYAAYFYHHAQYPWYYAPDLLVLAVALQVGLRRTPARLAGALVAAAALVTAAHTFKGRMAYASSQAADPSPRNELAVFHDTALLLDTDPRADRMLVAMHNAGVFGFFFRGRTMNLDGLANDSERLAAIRRDGYDFYPYLRRQAPVDAYTDYIPRSNLDAYDHGMPALGLRPLALERRLRARGSWWTGGPGAQRLYARHPLAGMDFEP